MKILQVNASYKPAYVYGGPTVSVANLSEELVKAGILVEVFTTTANGKDELPVAGGKKTNVDGVNVTYFRRITKDHSHFSPQLLKHLWNEVRNHDVVHIHAWWNLVSIMSAMFAHLRKVKVLISPRGTLSSYSFHNRKSLVKNIFHCILGRRILNKSYIHVTSAAEFETVNGIVSHSKIFNIGNIIDVPAVTGSKEFKIATPFKLLFLSRIEEKKGLDILLRALALIDLPFHLTIAGDGNTLYVEQLKNEITGNLSEYVSWIGFQKERKFEVLRDHDLLILPSYDENFGNVIIESLFMGTAVLVSKYVGLAAYVKERGLGWLCDTTPESVAESINNIMKWNKNDLLRIRKNSSKILTEDFDRDKMIQQYVDMYNFIIDHE